MQLGETHLKLIDGWQRGFPLHSTPYARIALDLGVSELTVLGMLRELARLGVLSRVGAVVAPNTAGASTLAAMAVPRARLEEVAQEVNAEPGVNHNYERGHRFNLWFVVTGRNRKAVGDAIGRIAERTGLDVLDLPLRTAYHIDLGFPVAGGNAPQARPQVNSGAAAGKKPCISDVCAEDLNLLQAIEDGIPVVARPYAEIASRAGMSEDDVIERLDQLVQAGIVKRLGLVVRHRELGYRANAMVVWDIADNEVDAVGETFARYPFVTLCYRRDRHRPRWPYNLFCMIHGRDRETVMPQIEELRACAGDPPMDVLFSLRRFKQRGARLSAA
ncbi:MAG: Lrp/AsnC family transcriptional regulator [Hyphomicrobiaceae bacterium]|nr:Lrp/AsnC family transcriptional regulator [Hyphomicrobiaceae bacterium]